MWNVCVQVCKQLHPLIGAQQEDQRYVAAMMLLRSLLVADLGPKHPFDPTLCCLTLSDLLHQANALAGQPFRFVALEQQEQLDVPRLGPKVT